jgi:hypothetical protein
MKLDAIKASAIAKWQNDILKKAKSWLGATRRSNGR